MSFKTSIVHLPDGNDICYMDSGPVEGSSTYTTLLIIHGLGFNGHAFEPVHSKAAQYGLRTIAMQRRDYTGSSKYTDAELLDLQSGKPAHLDRLAITLGHFIQHLIQTHDIPEPNKERTEGGIVVLAWSLGSATAMTLLADSRLFGQDQYDLLRRYIVRLIFYDPPFIAFGFKKIGGERGQPMLGPTPEAHFERFRFYVGSYYDNPYPWDGDVTKIDQRPRTEHCTVDSWTQEQWDKIYQGETALRSEMPTVRGPMQMTILNSTLHALCDESNAKSTFPDLPILHLLCHRSLSHTPLGYQSMRALYKERNEKGLFMRPISFKVIEGANHMWHWDCPAEFLETIASIARGEESTDSAKSNT